MSDAPRISLTTIARRRIPELDRLVDELLPLGPAFRSEIVVGVETPGTAHPEETVDERGVRWIALPPGRGIGYNRNRVTDAARGELLVGVDDDCVPKPGWLENLCSALEDPLTDAAVGSIEIPPAGFVGDSISALGFPAGGTAGYETMFPVDADGRTHNIAAGNCVLRASALRELGGWDESLSWGGEDTELAYRFDLADKRIAFVKSATIVHPARANLVQFSRWLFIRGRAKCQFARKVPISGFVGNRIASYGRILRAHSRDAKLVLIVPLLVASILLQQAGFATEWLFPRRSGND